MTNVLVLSAEPRGELLPGVYREVRHIQRVLADSSRRFNVRILNSARLVDLQRELREFLPELVHFSGHGSSDGIILEGSEGHPHLVTGLELAQLFHALDSVTKCVFLNADHTAAIAENVALAVDEVVAHSNATSDEDAADFAEIFYNHLADGHSVGLSFEKAKLRIIRNDGRNSPLLILRSKKAVSESVFRLALLEPDLVLALVKEPNLMGKLDWRSFERLLAQILEKFGYEIELQRGTKDGGVDLFALKKQGIFGPERYLLQAKRWSAAVGVEPVREIAFLHSHHRMTKSCLASTSRFTRGAWALANEYRWQLELRDSEKLKEWIELAASVR